MDACLLVPHGDVQRSQLGIPRSHHLLPLLMPRRTHCFGARAQGVCPRIRLLGSFQQYPLLRSLCCLCSFVQRYHKLNVNLQRRLYGHATNVDIKPLNESAAVATASDLVGELIVFGVGGGLVILEVSRSAISEAKKEEARRQEREVGLQEILAFSYLLIHL